MANLDDVVHSVLSLYITLSYNPPHNQHTVLAAFVISSQSQPNCKVIGLATGTKCLPTVKYPVRGEALHDCHAEIVARRAALRWFLEEIARRHDSQQSPWICLDSKSGKYRIRADVRLWLYISTLPCGDASMRYLAASQDEEMARLKDSSPPPPPTILGLPNPHSTNPGLICRGRDGYSRLGLLRTKPGRADSPPTICMSCSDKIAAWNVHGIQGALGSYVLHPLYIDDVVIGEVLPNDDSLLRQMIQGDCQRALWGRVANFPADLPCGYSAHRPVIHFTNVPFAHSKAVLAQMDSDTNPTNESLCWIADRPGYEVLINGFKRGVLPKHRLRDKSRPLVCKLSMYQLLKDTLVRLSLQPLDSLTTYIQCKRGAEQYQNAKKTLRGPRGPFSGWIQSGPQWESFYLDGRGSIDVPS